MSNKSFPIASSSFPQGYPVDQRGKCSWNYNFLGFPASDQFMILPSDENLKAAFSSVSSVETFCVSGKIYAVSLLISSHLSEERAPVSRTASSHLESAHFTKDPRPRSLTLRGVWLNVLEGKHLAHLGAEARWCEAQSYCLRHHEARRRSWSTPEVRFSHKLQAWMTFFYLFKIDLVH